MGAIKERVQGILDNLENVKCELWDLLENVSPNKYAEKEIKDSMNYLLDYVETLLDGGE